MRTIGLIGYPLTHSFSQQYFTRKFEIESLENWSYKNFPIQSIDEMRNLLHQESTLSGFNVTSPYKQSVMGYLDEIDESAKCVNAVNVVKIKREDDRLFLKGYNTDVYGFQKSFNEKVNSKIKNALILGTGGAAEAVAYVLDNMHITYQFVSRENLKNSNDVMLYSDLNQDIITNHQLIVNASPVGMYPYVGNKPDIPYAFIGAGHFLFDLIYNPAETLFLQMGKKQGAKISNGYDMLIYQAERGWEIISGD